LELAPPAGTVVLDDVGCPSCLLYEVRPFRIINQILKPARIIIVATGLDATRL